MKVMMIDLYNYAGLRVDDYGEISKPNVWDVYQWCGDMIRYYQDRDYNVVLYTTQDQVTPKDTDVMNRLCNETGIHHHFTRGVRGNVIDSRYDPLNQSWKQYKITTDENALQYAINYVKSFQPEEFFVTADSYAVKKICEDLCVTYTNIDEVHSIALGLR